MTIAKKPRLNCKEGKGIRMDHSSVVFLFKCMKVKYMKNDFISHSLLKDIFLIDRFPCVL